MGVRFEKLQVMVSTYRIGNVRDDIVPCARLGIL